MARSRFLSVLCGLLLFGLFAACGNEEAAQPPVASAPVEPVASDDMLAAAEEAGLSTLVSLADSTGLADQLRGEGPFTLFAPTNSALEAFVDASTLTNERLTQTLAYHLVPGSDRYRRDRRRDDHSNGSRRRPYAHERRRRDPTPRCHGHYGTRGNP